MAIGVRIIRKVRSSGICVPGFNFWRDCDSTWLRRMRTKMSADNDNDDQKDNNAITQLNVICFEGRRLLADRAASFAKATEQLVAS